MMINNDFGYPVNLSVIGKPTNRGVVAWTILNEWTIVSEIEAVKYQLQGYDVIWSLVSKTKLKQSIEEFDSKQFINAKKKATDSNGNRTISDSMIEWCDTVLIDFDECTLKDVPQGIIDNAWLMLPSASQIMPTEDGDVAKMHFIHKMPFKVEARLTKAYRQRYLELVCEGKKYDIKTVDPRREFYGKNPKFTDERFIRFNPENLISIDIHTQIIEEIKSGAVATNTTDKPGKGRPKKDAAVIPSGKTKQKEAKKSISQLIDEHILNVTDLGSVVSSLFSSSTWSQKGSSSTSFDQWESTNPFLADATNPTAFAIHHSRASNRILCHYKGDDFTASLYEMYARYKLHQEGIEDAYTMSLNGQLTGKKFFNLTNEICEKLDIPPYENEVSYQDYMDTIGGYVWVVSDQTDKNTFYYWNVSAQIWMHTINRDGVTSDCIEPILSESFGDLSKFDARKIAAQMTIDIPRDSDFKIKDHLEPDNNLIAFSNGVFNIKLKRLEDNTPDHHVFSRFNFPFEMRTSDSAERILKFLKVFVPQEGNAELLMDFFYASFFRLGQRWARMMILHGGSGSGKSTIMQSFKKIDEKMVLEVEESSIESGSYPYSQYHQGIASIYIDDASDINSKRMSSMFRMLTENSYVPFSKKFANTINMKRHAVFASTSEELPIELYNTKAGIGRRYFDVKTIWNGEKSLNPYEHDPSKSVGTEMLDIFDNTDVMRDFYLWAIVNIEPEDVLRRYKENSSNSVLKSTQKMELAESSTVAAFVEEKCIVADSPDDFIVRDKFIEEMKRYAIKTNDQYIQRLTDIRLLKHACKDIQSTNAKGENFIYIKNSKVNSQGRPAQVSINGKLTSVVWGIKWKPEIEHRIDTRAEF